MEHTFTENIKAILQKHFGINANDIYEKSQLIHYLNIKTRSATKGSKSRSSFANLYAIYVLVDDYISSGYHTKEGYSEKYEGAMHSVLLSKINRLPFGEKIQNHALDNRVNDEFRKKISKSAIAPIEQDPNTKRLYINENLLKITVGDIAFNLAEPIIEIIDEYVKTKQDSFQRFINDCRRLQNIEGNDNPDEISAFITALLAPKVDARLFEIVSYSILKYYYHDQLIIWGYSYESLVEDKLKLYKTGRTNANDGGIDFVMQPLGRFFQVTETLNFKKYFLDIDKIQKYPITFVIKSTEEKETLKQKIRRNASKTYSISAIVDNYMSCIEEIINIPTLQTRLSEAINAGYLKNILDEIVSQSKVEFNVEDIVEEAEE